MGFDSKVIRIVKLWQLQSVVVNISSKNMCTNDLSYCLCESVDWHWLTLDGSNLFLASTTGYVELLQSASIGGGNSLVRD